jgi:hypothetical protein
MYEVQSRKYELRITKYEIVPQAEFPTSIFCTGRSAFDISLNLVLRLPAAGWYFVARIFKSLPGHTSQNLSPIPNFPTKE